MNFQDAGAIVCKKTALKACDSSSKDAVKNTALMNATLAALQPGDTVSVLALSHIAELFSR